MKTKTHEPRSVSEKINVWLTDDSELFCRAVIDGLANNPHLKVERYFRSAEALLQSLNEESDHPNVILLDVEMPGMDGLEAIERIKQLSPVTRTIMLSCHDDEQYVRVAIQKGAAGYLLKPGSPSEIENAVRVALTGLMPIDKRAISRLVQDGRSDDALKVLTRRESQVFQLVAEKLSRKEIAQRLSISPETVHFHLQNIYFKLGVHDKRELTQEISVSDLHNISSHF